MDAQRERELKEIAEKVVSAADQIIAEVASDNPLETHYLQACVAEEFMKKMMAAHIHALMCIRVGSGGNGNSG